MSKLTTIDFHDDTLFAVEAPGGVFVAVKPICDGLGIDPKKQRERIQRDPVLTEGGAMMALPSAGGPQETFCLRLDLLQGWLFGIDAARVAPEARDRVLAYKRECCAVLFRHFYGERVGVPVGNAQPAREEPVPIRRQLVTEARQTFGPRAAGSLWFALGLPIVPEMQEGAPQQGAFGFTYTAIPASAERSA
ncbi:phage antirepressor N-terminal domain-containing protein [Methylorubrum extorquens]|uniref:Phage P22, antirepressor protein n=1 Tax=Methylorubrum extorquens DSM 13060 TaxID=882800 RepID=H1KGB1_METEX|nr:phage antirepressor N-terminal domain-containing protein [Methylorubrum extorquens]EHP93452.1 Phage P22, antirepressor protein [Methylorubrum extorquens DSM 13060]